MDKQKVNLLFFGCGIILIITFAYYIRPLNPHNLICIEWEGIDKAEINAFCFNPLTQSYECIWQVQDNNLLVHQFNLQEIQQLENPEEARLPLLMNLSCSNWIRREE